MRIRCLRDAVVPLAHKHRQAGILGITAVPCMHPAKGKGGTLCARNRLRVTAVGAQSGGDAWLAHVHEFPMIRPSIAPSPPC